MTHTPAPWIVGTENNILAMHGEHSIACMVCIVNSGETHLANARLIAAAPELLAALEVAKRYLPDDELATDRLTVDRAIAKARGTEYRIPTNPQTYSDKGEAL